MNAKELDCLLEKYYKGESCQEDELKLRNFFSGDSVPEGYEAERAIFSFYQSENEIPEPSYGFESGILEGIKRMENTRNSMNFRRHLIPILGAAAGLLIMAGTYLYFSQSSVMKDTYSDPKIAYLETRKVLLEVSAKMNRAKLTLEPVGKMDEMKRKSFTSINKTTGIIEKNLKNLNVLPSEVEALGEGAID